MHNKTKKKENLCKPTDILTLLVFQTREISFLLFSEVYS